MDVLFRIVVGLSLWINGKLSKYPDYLYKSLELCDFLDSLCYLANRSTEYQE